jgi:periplasmic protein TonB
MVDNDRNRVFHYAVLASLALHGLLLFGFPDLIDTARRAASLPPTLIARLMAPEPVAEPAPAPPPPEKKAEVAKPAPRITKPVPQLAPPAPPEVKAEAPAPPVETPAAAPAPAPVRAPPPIAAVAPQSSESSSKTNQVPESLSRDQYRVQLIDEARRHKRYPPLARENNWQGDVRVAVAVTADGRPTVTLRGSSGYEVLDRQALEMFRQAARAVPVPAALRGKEFALEVRAVYGLEE